MVKTKKCEEYTAKYKHTMDAIHLGVDGTDHICFFCPECENALSVIECITRTVPVTTDGLKREKCTWIYLVCHNCKLLGKRKFYWTGEDGKFCYQKTSDWKKNETPKNLLPQKE